MKESAVDRAHAWLRERILDGRLESGTFVDEAMICEGADVSRTPAREALNRLEGERFVKLVPRRGAQIREFSSSDLARTRQARLMVETFAVADFCAARRPVPEAMRDALRRMEELSDAEMDLQVRLAYQEADQSFHSAFVETLDNAAVMEFFESLWRFSRWSMVKSVDWLLSDNFVEQNLDQHRRLIEALEAHREDDAIAILRLHLPMSNR